MVEVDRARLSSSYSALSLSKVWAKFRNVCGCNIVRTMKSAADEVMQTERESESVSS